MKKWQNPDGRFLHNLTGHNCIVNSLAVNADGVMASGGDAGQIHMWDWKAGHCFQTLETIAQPGSLESERGIFSRCKAPEHKSCLLYGSPRTSQLCLTADSVFDQSGARLITGEADKTIKMWKEDPDATEATHPAESVAPRASRRY